jgi:SET domain-containing protein
MDIKQGEEITCDYKYSLGKAPKWYVDALAAFLQSRPAPAVKSNLEAANRLGSAAKVA